MRQAAALMDWIGFAGYCVAIYLNWHTRHRQNKLIAVLREENKKLRTLQPDLAARKLILAMADERDRWRELYLAATKGAPMRVVELPQRHIQVPTAD